MKRFLTLLTASLVIAGFSTQAQAGFLIEPFIDYAVSGDHEQGSTDGDLSATMFGARLGMTTLGLMYGVEYSTGTFTEKYSDNSEGDGNSTDMGVFVGYEFPVMIRVWLSYYLQSTLEDDNSSLEYKGSGTKIGVGYTGLPFVSVNLQMLNRSYDEYETSAASGSLTNDAKHTAYLLGISLPLP